MQGFLAFFSFLKYRNQSRYPERSRGITHHLTKLGYFHEKDEEKNDVITRELDNGIRAFQKDKDLRVDGILKPGGETERAVFQAVEGKRGDAYFRLAELARTPGINDKPARTDATGRIIRERDAVPIPQQKPGLTVEQRKQSILEGGLKKFKIVSNSEASVEEPWYSRKKR